MQETQRFDSGHAHDDVVDDRQRLLRLMLMADRRRRDDWGIIRVRAESKEPAPLSFAQERLWFLDKLGLVGTAYNVVLALRISGNLECEALEGSFIDLIRRHESFRTCFGVREGTPHQTIQPSAEFHMERVDLTGEAELGREELLRARVQLEQLRPFDLEQGSLLRVVLMQLDTREHALLVTTHHIAADGWSVSVLLRELSASYAAHTRHEPASSATPALQYADYAVWQRQWLQGENLAQQLQYWKEHLTGASSQVALPTDRPRPAVERFRGAEVKLMLPLPTAEGLKALARRQGCTLFMACLAAYYVLLSRWSGQQDITVGTPIAGRTSAQLEGVIGCFVNTLALRTNAELDWPFLQLLECVREVTLSAFAHQDAPFEAIVKELRPERSLASQPLFQVMLTLQNVPEHRLDLPGVRCTWIDTESVAARCDLTAHVTETADGLSIAFQYATDLFDGQTIERMARSFERITERIVASPECPISELPLLDEHSDRTERAMRQAIAIAPLDDRLIYELFEEQAQRTPTAIAIVHGQTEFTYAELSRRSSQLAQYLRCRGIGPDQLVALCFDRSPEMVISMLGVLKAGGAYVPLDPANPPERLALILQDARPMLLLTQQAQGLVAKAAACPAVFLDQDQPYIDASSAECPDPRSFGLTNRSLAYVIYTSGSTGTPKGVMVEHRSIANYTQHARRQFDIDAGGGSLICTSFSFDLMLTGLYPTLASGRPLRLCSGQDDLAALTDEIVLCQDLAPLKVTPSHLPLLERLLRAGQLAGRVRSLVIGGESLPARAIELWQELSPQTRIFNHYGPTETTVGCLVNPIEGPVRDPVPIGYPIANAHAYILDRKLRPLPTGVVGEICIGGVGVARGYLGRPDLTAERFLTDPFSTDPQARMYRTGDLGRRRSDGRIEFLGRSDQQVKFRGYRIELREIEATLRRHPSIQVAAVLLREDPPGNRRLVGYVVTDQRPALDADLLAPVLEFLRANLPDYMIPSGWVVLGKLPLTSNGKLDRRALPPPQAGLSSRADGMLPRNAREQALLGIWQEILGVSSLGVDENFFELGGDSLHGVRLITKVEEQLKVRLQVIAVFQYPTIMQMAEAIEAQQSTSGSQSDDLAAIFDEGSL